MKSSEENKNDFDLTIFLYDDPSSKTLDLSKIRVYLKQKLGDIDVRIRSDFITFHLRSKNVDEYVRKFAQCKVRNLSNPLVDLEPLPGELRYEKKLIEHPEEKLYGVLYDGYRLDMAFQQLITKEELDLNKVHIVFTNRLFGTFDVNDHRYHARVILCGFPSLISTTGIVEAPAKPKEFYHLKQNYSMLGMDIPFDIIKKELQGRFIEYDDPRLTEIMKGYVMQSIFYHLIHKPFCEDKNCRLFNAHWQDEVINAQLNDGDFCKKHETILQNIRNRRFNVKSR